MSTHALIQKILHKIGDQKIVSKLAQNLSGSEFNSLMLEVFKQRAASVSPSELLRNYEKNRFTLPASSDPIRILERKLNWLQAAKIKGFEPVTCSPAAPFGSCSSFGTVHQDKVISAVRGTEIMADATNILALQLALSHKKGSKDLKRFATTHRHIRAQHFDQPNFTAHFEVFGMASGGVDSGSFRFEKEELIAHLSLILHLLRHSFPDREFRLAFYLKENPESWKARLENWLQNSISIPMTFQEDPEHHYYESFQFKVFLTHEGHLIDLADGGLVDWTKMLTGNQKHRCLISGIGLELVEKLASNPLP
ncbi:MAG: hypothetical protein ACJLTB_07140 [Algoriphagus aquaeductus]|uniref:hypothetical protein n=1 Tax=Algoriphagus aquaeductus TaxID=475299 RepID=UPI00387924FA